MARRRRRISVRQRRRPRFLQRSVRLVDGKERRGRATTSLYGAQNHRIPSKSGSIYRERSTLLGYGREDGADKRAPAAERERRGERRLGGSRVGPQGRERRAGDGPQRGLGRAGERNSGPAGKEGALCRFFLFFLFLFLFCFQMNFHKNLKSYSNFVKTSQHKGINAPACMQQHAAKSYS